MPRITRGGVALSVVVFTFAALLVFGGHLFGGESHSTAPPSVPAADASPAVSVPAAPPQNSSVGSSGGALPGADGVQAASDDTSPTAATLQPRRSEALGW